jgi:hypothetical protein
MREGEGGGKAMLLMLRGTLSLLPHTQCVAAVNEPSVCSKYDARRAHAVMTGRELKYAPRMNK